MEIKSKGKIEKKAKIKIDNENEVKKMVTSSLENMYKRLEENMDLFKETRSDVKKLVETTQEIKLQTTKTNGRVNGLEAWSEDAKRILESALRSNEENKDNIIIMGEKNKSFFTAGKLIIGIIAFFIIGFTAMAFTLAENKLNTESQKTITAQIDTAVKKALSE